MKQNRAVVCILAAGVGSRMGEYTKVVNKGLLPIDDKAILSHIFEKFDNQTEFVVAVGYKSDQVRNYILLAHPELNIRFVEIDNFDQTGSGPGYSLFCCRDFLVDKEFYFLCNDSIWKNELAFETDKNSLGLFEIPAEQSNNYSTVKVKNHQVMQIEDKHSPIVEIDKYLAFTGIAYIKDYKIFWDHLEKSVKNLKEKEIQVIQSFLALVKNAEVGYKILDWVDLGSEEKYKKEIKSRVDFDFSKSSELFYSVGERVVKFFENETITSKRVSKIKYNETIFPDEIKQAGQFYSYNRAAGDILYNSINENVFSNFLNWLEEKVWILKSVDNSILKKTCHDFYYDKTMGRLELYERKYKAANEISIINNREIPAVNELINKINWSLLETARATFIHGDLQPDNVIYNNETGQFKLIDWRQDFAGQTEFGDLYYDFAKLWGGLILNYSEIKKNQFKYSETVNTCTYSFKSLPDAEVYIGLLKKKAEKLNLSIEKIQYLVPVIFLNMAPLHHSPFDKLLHAVGRSMLFDKISDE